LFDNLSLRSGQLLLVRGATSALGQAAVDIAIGCGAIVLASTRSQEKTAMLQAFGVRRVFIDRGQLSTSILEAYPDGIDCVLDVVGNAVLKDSLKMLKKGGRLCEVGFLGGGGPVDAFNPLVDLPSGVQLSFFASGLVFGNRNYPLSEIPMQEILNRLAEGFYRAKPAHLFRFHQLAEAHALMESNKANGKIVIVM
jgi:NADPH:quinone reductase-like Zn-dependent oxidoreductase